MDASLLKRLIVGKPMPLAQARHERLSKTVALAVFSSDALSSVAYATEEILLVLVLAGAAAAAPARADRARHRRAARGRRRLVPADHPRLSGGRRLLHRGARQSRPDARAGRGRGAAHRLRADRGGQRGRGRGRAHLRRAGLLDHRVALGVVFIALIAFANLRGVRESGRVFAVPTYLFIVDLRGAWSAAGLCRWLRGDAASRCRARCRGAEPADLVPGAARLLLRLHGADRRGGDLERRARLQAARGHATRRSPWAGWRPSSARSSSGSPCSPGRSA